MILLVAIIAAIALTLRQRKDTKHIDPSEQVARARRATACASSRWRPTTERRRPRPQPPAAAETAMSMTLTLGHFLSLGAILFALSVIGIFLNRTNLIVLLMAIELMLLAVNMNFVAFSHYLGDMARPGVRVLHPDRGRRRIGDRPGDPGACCSATCDTINVDDLDTLKG